MNNINNFLGMQREFENAEYIILPFPYEFTTTFGKGTGKGPKKIIEVSPNLEFYDEEIDEDTYKRGIHTLKPIIAEEFKNEEDINKIKGQIISYINSEKKLITIGGEHSISYPIVKGFSEATKELGVIHFDAHTDLRDIYENSKYNHACVMRRITELNLPVVSAGIRSTTKEELLYSKHKKNNLFFAQETYNDYRKITEAINNLPEQVYITLDVDVFSPELIRATGTPEPGGYSWFYMLEILNNIFKTKQVKGIDIVETCPDPIYEVSTFTIAKLIYKIIGYWK